MRRSPDPMAPYAWELTYTDGRRLCRDSPGGPWTERTVPLEGLAEVALWGHPESPLRIPVGWLARSSLAGVCFRQRATLTLGGGLVVKTRRWLVGVRYGDGHVDAWRITPAGTVTRYQGALAEW